MRRGVRGALTFVPLSRRGRAAVEDEAGGVLRMTAPKAAYGIRSGRVGEGGEGDVTDRAVAHNRVPVTAQRVSVPR